MDLLGRRWPGAYPRRRGTCVVASPVSRILRGPGPRELILAVLGRVFDAPRDRRESRILFPLLANALTPMLADYVCCGVSTRSHSRRPPSTAPACTAGAARCSAPWGAAGKDEDNERGIRKRMGFHANAGNIKALLLNDSDGKCDLCGRSCHDPGRGFGRWHGRPAVPCPSPTFPTAML